MTRAATRYGQTVRSIANEVENPIRFPGQYLDAESGLHYNRFRYYDPQAGRYINQDPIGFAGGINNYAYADNRPSHAIDPLGLATIAAGAGTGAEMGAVGGPVGAAVGAIVGGVFGTGVMIFAAQAVSSSASYDKAGLKVGSVAETLEPPGNCSPKEQRRLQDEVNRTCKRNRSCQRGMTQAELLQMREYSRECAMARDLMNKRCFAGGDKGHRDAAIDAWLGVTKCEGMIQ